MTPAYFEGRSVTLKHVSNLICALRVVNAAGFVCNCCSKGGQACEGRATLQGVVDLHLPLFCLLRLSCRILSATKVLSSAVLGAVSGVILPKSTGYMPRLRGAAVASTSSASSPGLEAASHR